MEWIDLYNLQSEDIYKKESVKLSRWPLFVFLCSAIACLSFSATFHLCFVHSKNLSAFLARLDYAGISILIAGSCYPPYYYLFYCSSSNLYFLFRFHDFISIIYFHIRSNCSFIFF
jgi:predicted membrane channel-forming protein YqfA (hemolysin III family)